MKAQESIGRWIAHIYRQSMIYIGSELKDHNISPGQIPVIMVLFHKDGLSQQEISDILHIDKATTGRAIKKLLEAGYVRREQDSDDRRAYHVFLTDNGREMKPIIKNVLEKWANILSAGFSREEREAITSLLKRMHQNALVRKQ